MTSNLPASAEAITVEWLREALPADLRPERIEGVRVETISDGKGFAGQVASLDVTTSDGEPFPPLIVKHAAEFETARELMLDFGGYEREVNI